MYITIELQDLEDSKPILLTVACCNHRAVVRTKKANAFFHDCITLVFKRVCYRTKLLMTYILM
jgi:hypothetical protein